MNDLVTWIIVYGSGIFTGWVLCKTARIRRLTRALDTEGARLEATMMDQLETLKKLTWDDPFPPTPQIKDCVKYLGKPYRSRPASMTGFTLN